MSDLVKRLRGMAAIGWNPIGDEAADEIEELKAEVNKKREVLLATIGVAETLTNDNEELKTDLTTAESAVADLMELNEDLTAQRDSLMKVCEDETGAIKKLTEERDRLREALTWLVKLKNTKDILGKTKEYLEDQPHAWHSAKEALNHKEG